jgi:hypothetical protein
MGQKWSAKVRLSIKISKTGILPRIKD